MATLFTSEGGIFTKLKYFPLSEYEIDLVTYDKHFSTLNSITTCNGAEADIFQNLMNVKLITADVSAHKAQSDPKGQKY